MTDLRFWKVNSVYMDLPRLPFYFRCMPCSSTPRVPESPTITVLSGVAFWSFDPSANPDDHFSEFNHFNLTVYGLQLTLPTLNLSHYYDWPKVEYEMYRVGTFSAALTAASRVALSWRTAAQAWGREPPQIDAGREASRPTSPHLEPIVPY